MEHTFDIYLIDEDNSGNKRWHFDGQHKDGTYTQGFFQIIPDERFGPSIIINIGEKPVRIGVRQIKKLDEKKLQIITHNGEIFVARRVCLSSSSNLHARHRSPLLSCHRCSHPYQQVRSASFVRTGVSWAPKGRKRRRTSAGGWDYYVRIRLDIWFIVRLV